MHHCYTDPSGNVFNDGKDCANCGSTEGQQIGAGGIIGIIVNNWDDWDDWGIKEWANKNINGDKISKWWKSKVSTKNLFGRHKSSGPPTNMSKYANFNKSSKANNVVSQRSLTEKYNATGKGGQSFGWGQVLL